MLKVNDINVYYGAIHAIKGVSFEVNDGEVVTLIGANGAGKSTILNTVCGLLRSRTGSIEFLGRNLASVPAHKIVELGMAHVPEGRRVFQQMTVEENLEMGAYTQARSAIEPGLERVYGQFPRLKERRRQVAGTLSGGEHQMLAMGRGLMSSPRLLMLDEPSMGLAPILVEQIFDIIRQLHQAGVTILLVEQNAQMALSVADRGYVLDSGNVVNASASVTLVMRGVANLTTEQAAVIRRKGPHRRLVLQQDAQVPGSPDLQGLHPQGGCDGLRHLHPRWPPVGESHLVELPPLDGMQRAAAGEKVHPVPAGLRQGADHVGAGQGGVAAQVHLPRRGKVADMKFPLPRPPDKGRLRMLPLPDCRSVPSDPQSLLPVRFPPAWNRYNSGKTG